MGILTKSLLTVLLFLLISCRHHQTGNSDTLPEAATVDERLRTEEQALRIHAGALAPSLTLPLLSDSTKQGSLPRDSVLLLFWASWCPDCHQAIPDIKAYLSQHPTVRLVTVTVDTDLNQARKYIRQEKIEGLHLADGQGWKSDAVQAYGVLEIPKTVLISPQGWIITTNSETVGKPGL